MRRKIETMLGEGTKTLKRRKEEALYHGKIGAVAMICLAMSPFTLTAVTLGFAAIHVKIAYDHHRYASKREKEEEEKFPTFHGMLGRRLHRVRPYVPNRLIRGMRGTRRKA